MSAPVTCRGTSEVPDALLRDLVAAGFVVGPPTPLSATVLDTFDGRLHEAGLRLEHRADTLVLTGPGTSVASLPAMVAPRFAVRPAGRGRCRARLADVTEIRTVLPVTTLTATTRRAERRNGDDKVVAAVTIQQRIAVGDQVIGGWLVGVDALTGYERQADDAFASSSPPMSVRRRTATSSTSPWRSPASTAGAGTSTRASPSTATCRRSRGSASCSPTSPRPSRSNLPGTLDDLDPEFLHDLRVAVRRTRSILRHGRTVLAPDVLAWAEPAMRSLGDLTSPPRDLDVQVIEWDERVAALDGDEARHDLEPLRRQVVADRDRRPRRADPAPRRGRRPPAPRPLDGAAGEPDGPARRRAARRRPDRRRRPRDRIRKAQRRLARPRPGDHAGDAGRARPRRAQGRQEAALPVGVLRRLAPRPTNASRSSSG